ncbi:MAG: M12 family metallo-peptidase, partial [Balneolales bacterium]
MLYSIQWNNDKKIRYQVCPVCKDTPPGFTALKRSTSILGLLIAMMFFSAQDGFSRTENNPTSPPEPFLFEFTAQKSHTGSFQAGDVLPISINRELLRRSLHKGDILDIPLFSGPVERYRITGISEFVEGYLAVRAVHVDNPFDQLTFSYGNGRILGRINRFSHHESFRIRPFSRSMEKSAPGSSSQEHVLEFIRPEDEDVLECGVNHEFMGNSANPLHHSDPNSQSHLFSPFDIESTLSGKVTLDLMIVYTENAKTWADGHSSLEEVVSEMMNKGQNTLENSMLDTELRIVHMHQTDFQEGDNSASDILRKLTASPSHNPFGEEYDGYMENIHDLRDEYGADLVTMLADISDVGGLAWLLNTPSGLPQFGFSLNRIQQVENSSLTFIHEIGHNAGNAHSRNQSGSPADVFGGLFDYSTGWRFTGDNDTSYATVMTYTEGKSSRIPYISNPDVPVHGVGTGSYTDQHAPADNARSMRYARHIIANYRPTEINPPLANMDNSTIEASVRPDNERSIGFIIGNNGSSALHWTTDVSYRQEDSPLLKSEPESAAAGTGFPVMDGIPKPVTTTSYPYLTRDGERLTRSRYRAEYSSEPLRNLIQVASRVTPELSADPQDTLTRAELLNDVSSNDLLLTGFESAEGYNSGEHFILNDWVTYPRDSLNTFTISTQNPKSGSQHIRLSPNTDLDESGETGVTLPFLGPLTSQGYSVSMDLYFSHDNTDNQFYIFLDEATSNQYTAHVLFLKGTIYVRNQADGTSFTSTSSFKSWEAGQYYHLEIRTDPRNDRILYFLDDEQIFEGDLYGGTAPEDILIAQTNLHTGETVDIDNIMIKSLQDPDFPRFQLRKQSGAVASGEQEEVQFTVIADGIPEDVYEFDLVIQTNDQTQQSVTIPVRFEVDESATSSDSAPVVSGYELHQNYPNPFNPVTGIRYDLPEPGEVRLEVFDL